MRALNASEARHSAQLETANKELEAFSYSVSHDLRSPLRAIDGYGIILLEDHSAQLDTEAKSLLHRIRAATQRMAQLIDDLLDLAHVTHGAIGHDDIDLSAMATEILDDLHSAEPAREVECAVEGGIHATGDQRLLLMMMQNLFENAWKFTMKTAHANIEFCTADRGGEKIYVVRDNGSGFDMAYASKLFGTFQRMHTTPDFPGSGVGLAIVQRIVRRHGGRIWADAAIDKGATFWFVLAGAVPDFSSVLSSDAVPLRV